LACFSALSASGLGVVGAVVRESELLTLCGCWWSWSWCLLALIFCVVLSAFVRYVQQTNHEIDFEVPANCMNTPNVCNNDLGTCAGDYRFVPRCCWRRRSWLQL
jgi:hypothetical protein